MKCGKCPNMLDCELAESCWKPEPPEPLNWPGVRRWLALPAAPLAAGTSTSGGQHHGDWAVGSPLTGGGVVLVVVVCLVIYFLTNRDT